MSGGKYAAKTDVPVDRSFDEIRRILTRFGADGFGYVEMGNTVGIQFHVNNVRVLMRMTLRDREEFSKDSYGRRRTESAITRDYDQAVRQKWRSLANGIKAKLALIDDGISTVEREFLADLLLPSGETVGERIVPDIHEALRLNELPSMMPGFSPKGRVIELGHRSGS
jgi:hypothetical protein